MPAPAVKQAPPFKQLDLGTAKPVEPVFVTFVSQNDSSAYYQNLINNQAAYVQYRTALVERATMIAGHGGKLHLQVDEPVIRAVEAFEGVWGTIPALRQSTGGKNVLQWLEEDMLMSVDPHATGGSYNLADLAYLLSQLGVNSTVMAGVPVYSCTNEEEGGFGLSYIDWRSAAGLNEAGTLTGTVFPNAQWRPEILSAPSMQHGSWGEYSSGTWRPGTGSAFGEHVGDSRIVYVGQGYPFDEVLYPEILGEKTPYSNAGYVKELAQKIADGFVDGEGPFTASVMIPDVIPTNPGPEAHIQLRRILGEFDVLAQEGKIVFASYHDAASEHDKRGAAASQVSFWSFTQFQASWEQASASCEPEVGAPDEPLTQLGDF